MNDPDMAVSGRLNRSQAPTRRWVRVRPRLTEAVDRIAGLYDLEEHLRGEGRRAELWPGQHEEARRLFRRASAARRLRLALLRRWHLL
jgi:hypothetical protein